MKKSRAVYPLVCCVECGRDTRSKSQVCSKCQNRDCQNESPLLREEGDEDGGDWLDTIDEMYQNFESSGWVCDD